jgi:hypothetical protein
MTVIDIADEVEVEKLPSPEYTAATEYGEPAAEGVVQSQVALPLEIDTDPQPVIVVAPYLRAKVPVADARTVAVNRTTPPAVIEPTELVIEGLAALLNPTTTLSRTDFVIPTVSVAVTCME